MKRKPDSGGHGRRRKRMFDYGDLRLLVLDLVSDRPCHGYELIKLIEARFDGAYTPSPGAIYPTLEWLVDMGFITITQQDQGRKSAAISDAGRAFLEANRATVNALWARRHPTYRKVAPKEIVEAMDALKLAIRESYGRDDSAEHVAAIATQIRDLAATLNNKGDADG
jgi:DNA-binding PadR family transcriptional regulator